MVDFWVCLVLVFLWFGIIWYCCGFGFSIKRCGGDSLFGDFVVGEFGYFG